jgi:hypothetical protein
MWWISCLNFEVSRISIFHLLLVLLLFPAACKNQKPEEELEGTIIAKAGQRVLLLEDIPSYLLENVSGNDSVQVVQNFALQWIKRQVLALKASKQLSEEEKDKSEELEEYLQDLLIFEYQSKLMNQLLDTQISLQAVEDYYELNKDNFELTENIVRLIFFKLPLSLKSRDRLWVDFRRGRPEDIEKLSLLAARNGGNFYLDDNNWLRFSDILKEIPIVTYNQELFLKNNEWIRLSDDEFDYFVRISEFRIKNSTSPFEFEKERIHQILLNRRKRTLMDSMEKKMLKSALDEGEVTLLTH